MTPILDAAARVMARGFVALLAVGALLEFKTFSRVNTFLL